MPELAEVQTVREVLKKQILNKKIKSIDIFYENMIENDSEYFKSNLVNNEFIDIKRKGKYLIFETNNSYMISHLRMEGKFFIKPIEDKKEKHEHIIFYFDNFTLRYHDTRKFGRMKIIPKEKLDSYFENIGEDANNITNKSIILQKINNSNLPIKTLLLDQSIMAGLGNIYVDEVLFASKINPLRKGKNIKKSDLDNIVKSSKEILDKAIEYKGTTIRSYTFSLGVEGSYQKFLKVHKRENKECENCHELIKKIRVGGRSTYYCPNCQNK